MEESHQRREIVAWHVQKEASQADGVRRLPRHVMARNGSISETDRMRRQSRQISGGPGLFREFHVGWSLLWSGLTSVLAALTCS